MPRLLSLAALLLSPLALAEAPKLIPAKLLEGSTKSLTYIIRAPETYKDKDAKTWPAIVILHGSNMNAKAYVNTLALAWPDIARDYILIGFNGEQKTGDGDNAQHNFTYINFVGRSTFKGYPGTDRESPALVAESLDQLREAYPIKHYFVGGHSQGGFLTYSLLMNYPEKIAGAFPVCAGVIFQCEPSAYADEKLRAAQRAVPLAIVHSKQDQVVEFGMGEYAAELFGESNWSALRFFADDSGAAHMFARLPVNHAIRWLEAQSSDDPKILLDFAEKALKANAFRDAIAAANRAATLNPKPPEKARLDRLTKTIDTKAAPGAKKFLPLIETNANRDWIDSFLEYRDQFEFAPAAKETMAAFTTLRAKHDPLAAKLMTQARAAFQQNKQNEGYAKYKELVETCYAASTYRTAKRWLAERK